jgi:hypothetical protein
MTIEATNLSFLGIRIIKDRQAKFHSEWDVAGCTIRLRQKAGTHWSARWEMAR